MRVLVAWGSKRGGTEGIARILGEELARAGFDVTTRAAAEVRNVAGYDAAIIGGALYANRWHRDARALVASNVGGLRRIPVWLFSSGPLDDSAAREQIPPVTQVAVLMERIGARGHVTFGGRLTPDAKGFPAAAMARTRSGDWRDPARVRAWAAEVAEALPTARPGVAIDPPARSPARLFAHALLGWLSSAVTMVALLRVARPSVALAFHAALAPIIFTAVAAHYFRPRGAHEPLPTAAAFAAVVAILDAAVVAGLVTRSFSMFASFVASWLPFLLIFAATWAIGFALSTRPWPGTKPPARA
jgi:menaquinone-dependent protoporphyrinogen oxidase